MMRDWEDKEAVQQWVDSLDYEGGLIEGIFGYGLDYPPEMVEIVDKTRKEINTLNNIFNNLSHSLG